MDRETSQKHFLFRPSSALKWLSLLALIGVAPVKSNAAPNHDRRAAQLSSAPLTSGALLRDNDAKILADISAKLFFDKFFTPRDLRFNSREGIVSVEGRVRDLRSKNRALLTIKGIRGVRSVVDRIEVQNMEIPDVQTAFDVTRALAVDASTENMRVKVNAAQGIVTLTGSATSWAEKRTAVWVAEGVRGVRAVRNLIDVKTGPPRTPSELTADIKAQINRNIWIPDGKIGVRVEGDKAFLSGQVATLAQKELLYDDAWIHGINEIDLSKVVIEPVGPSPDPLAHLTPIPDSEKVDAVREVWSRDSRVDHTELTLSVIRGHAVVKGKVNSLSAKKAAIEDLRNTRGIFEVTDRIQVSTKRPDAEIIAAVKELLSLDALVHAEDLQVTSTAGIVTLRGQLKSLREKYLAADDASRIRGVIEVRNQIKVIDQDTEKLKSDKFIRQALLKQINESPILSRNRNIKFEVRDGRVTLRGKASDAAYASGTVDAAFLAGARSVVNEIGRARGRGELYELPPSIQISGDQIKTRPSEEGRETSSGATSSEK